LFAQNNSDILFYTAHYNASDNRLEHRINPFPENTIAGDVFDTPVLNRTYFVPIDYDISVEPWMTKPFESNYYEEDLQIESWMESPFESNYYEEVPEVEPWMTRPFTLSEQIDVVIEKEIPVESWMSSPWI
jgi:hypothetical protein